MTTFRFEMTPTETTPLEEPDPEWVQRCAVAHEHRWGDGGSVTDARRVVRDQATDEYPEIAEMVCDVTGETITPRWRAPRSRTYIAGPKHYFLDDVEVTEQEAIAAVEMTS